MARKKRNSGVLPTIWHAPDELWSKVKPILGKYDPPKRKGRHRIDQRGALDAIIFRMRSGCQWNQLPKEYPDDSSVHRTFQRWVKLGIFDRIWADLIEDCEELAGVDWQWQSADTALGKARLGGTLLVPIPQTAPRMAQSEAWWWKLMAGLWVRQWLQPTSTTRSCWGRP